MQQLTNKPQSTEAQKYYPITHIVRVKKFNSTDNTMTEIEGGTMGFSTSLDEGVKAQKQMVERLSIESNNSGPWFLTIDMAWSEDAKFETIRSEIVSFHTTEEDAYQRWEELMGW